MESQSQVVRELHTLMPVIAAMVVELGPEVWHGQWSQAESQLSSTWRELRAVYLVLKSFAEKLGGHTVKWLTDNQGEVFIIRSGSKKEHLQDGALAIFELCFLR